MATIPTILTTGKPPVQYARLHGTLEGYLVHTAADALYFVDHDSHVYVLQPDQAQALTLLGAVAAVERVNVLAALARCEEVCG
jgi:hypothetical protein